MRTSGQAEVDGRSSCPVAFNEHHLSFFGLTLAFIGKECIRTYHGKDGAASRSGPVREDRRDLHQFQPAQGHEDGWRNL